MRPIKLVPLARDYIWGGTRLKTEFNIQTDLDPVAEAWMLSPTNDTSIIASGEHKGKPITSLLQEGEDVSSAFPLMVKFIDAAKPLSVQVHPSDSFAQEHYGTCGKTECWFVLDAQPGAYLYHGFSRPVDREEVRRRIDDGTLLEVLNKIEVKKNDVFLIESGTLHAIGPGVLVAEIQQNSPWTFRVYDFKRVDKDGKPRELHIEEALACMSLESIQGHRRPTLLKSEDGCDIYTMVQCPYFTAYIYEVRKQVSIKGTPSKWRGLLITDGQVSIKSREDGDSFTASKGEFFLLPRDEGEYEITGEAQFILVD